MTCVSEALRSTPKGRLKYDRFWSEEDIKEIVEDITERGNSLSIPLAALVQSSKHVKKNDDGIQNYNVIEETSSNNCISSRKPFCDLDISPQEMKAELTLREYDFKRQLDVEEAILNRRVLSENYGQLLVKQAKQQMQLIQAQQEQAVEFQTKYLEQETAIRKQEVQQRQQDLKERHKILAKLMTARMKEAEVTQKQMEEATQKRLLEQQQKFDILLACQREMNELFGKITESLRSCIHKHHLPDSAKQALGKLKEVSSTMDQCVASAKIKNVTSENVRIAQSLVHNVKEYLNAVQKGVEKANEMQGKAEKQPISTEEISKSALAVSDECIQKEEMGGEGSTTKQLSNQSENRKVSSPSTTFLTECTSSSALKLYVHLQDLLTKFQKSYQDLVSDSKLKQYRFDLQKAVNIPVNAISPQSGSHVRDKLERLNRLLLGQIVEVSNKRVSANDHAQARQFCKDLLAKKFVKQGEEQVSSKYEAAFSIAVVIIGLWTEFPDFGDLLLAYFYQRCPYIVPFYIPKQSGQSQEDHYKALGYIYYDGTIEKQDKFLKRMSGMMRLYAAIIHSPVPKGINKPHPHSVECGWKWLTRVLNLEPQPDITATMLFDFLEVAGSTLQQSYGRQFLKLLHLLCNSYFPKIRSVTPNGAGGPLTRLENFLHKCLQQGKIPVPEGSLSSSFWYS